MVADKYSRPCVVVYVDNTNRILIKKNFLFKLNFIAALSVCVVCVCE